jgi:hypothetical protein
MRQGGWCAATCGRCGGSGSPAKPNAPSTPDATLTGTASPANSTAPTLPASVTPLPSNVAEYGKVGPVPAGRAHALPI